MRFMEMDRISFYILCFMLGVLVGVKFMKSGELKVIPLVNMSVPLHGKTEDDSVNGT